MVMRRSSRSRLLNQWAHNYKYHNAAGIWLPPRTGSQESDTTMLDIFKLYDPSDFDNELPSKPKKKKRSKQQSSSSSSPDISSPEKTPTLSSQSNDDSRSQRSGLSSKSELERRARLEEEEKEERQKKIAAIELRRKLELRLWDLEKTFRYIEHPEVTADRELKCYLLSTI